MSSSQSPCRADFLRDAFKTQGAVAAGAVEARAVDAEAIAFYRQWLADGKHGGMEYLAKYDDVRNDPRMLLEGARSLLVAAFPYFRNTKQPDGSLPIALYARGDDYHDVLRTRLETIADAIRRNYGGMTRVCVDTAPLRERYWARMAGIGFIGRNGCLIVPGAGSYCFLGIIISTAAIEPWSENFVAEAVSTTSCQSCGSCIRACPNGAFASGGYNIDARKCISYLTIEHRGDFPTETDLHGSFFGCDRCQAVCPYNRAPIESDIVEFKPRSEIVTLTAADLKSMTPEQFSVRFRRSPLKRAKLPGLLRNLKYMKP